MHDLGYGDAMEQSRVPDTRSPLPQPSEERPCQYHQRQGRMLPWHSSFLEEVQPPTAQAPADTWYRDRYGMRTYTSEATVSIAPSCYG